MAWWWKCVVYTHTHTHICVRVCLDTFMSYQNENHINKNHLPEIPKQTQLIFSRNFFGVFFLLASHHFHFMGHVLCKSSTCLTLIWFCQLLLLLLLFSFFTVRGCLGKIGFLILYSWEEANWLYRKKSTAKIKLWLTCFLFKRENYLPKMSMEFCKKRERSGT